MWYSVLMKWFWRIAPIAFIAFVFISLANLSALDRQKVQSAQLSNASVCAPDTVGLLTLINNERVALGIAPLATDSTLTSTSGMKLESMVSGTYYGHDTPDGAKYNLLLSQNGVNAASAEDLLDNANTANENWIRFKASSSHYKTFTDPQYTRIGIAESCVDYVLKTPTPPDDNTSLVGKRITELTVIHLAAPELNCASVCRDGACSPSVGQGTCSHHNGVAY